MMEIRKQGKSDTATSGGIHELIKVGAEIFPYRLPKTKAGLIVQERRRRRREGGTSSGVGQNFLAIESTTLLGSGFSIMGSVHNRHLSLSNLGFHCPHPTTLILSEIFTLTFWVIPGSSKSLVPPGGPHNSAEL